MVWTEEHDLLPCREIIAAEVFPVKGEQFKEVLSGTKLQASYVEFHDRILRWTNGMLNFNVICLELFNLSLFTFSVLNRVYGCLPKCYNTQLYLCLFVITGQ